VREVDVQTGRRMDAGSWGWGLLAGHGGPAP